MKTYSTPLDDHLRTMLGPDADFREGQREAIEAVIGDGQPGARRPAHGLGQEPRLLDRDAGPPRRGPRADAHRQPAPRPHAQPDRDGRPAGPPRRDDQLGQHGRVGRRRGGARGRRDRRPADLARAPRQRGLREPDPARDPGIDRPVRRRRGALHQRLGPRLPARLPADRADPAQPLAVDPGPRDDGDRQRPGRRGRGRAARGGRPDRPRPAGTGVAQARDGHARRPGRAAGVAREVHPEPARQRHRLLPDRRRHAAGRHLAALAWHRRPCLQRGALDRGARGARGRADRRRDEGARRDGRARDGLRQAGPRLGRPLPAAGLADRLLPAGGPRRAGGRLGLGHPPRRSRGRPDRGVLHPDRLSADGQHGGDPRDARSRRWPDVGGRAPVRGQPAEGPHRAGAQAARDRRRGGARRRPLHADRRTVGAGRGAHRTRDRDPPRRAGRDAGLRRPHRLLHGVPRPGVGRPGGRTVRQMRQRPGPADVDARSTATWSTPRSSSCGATCGRSGRASSGSPTRCRA